VLILKLRDNCKVKIHYGNKYWHQNDKRHRLDGPAVDFANGYKVWFQHGKLHRLDGPAVEHSDGNKFWYQNGKPWVAPEER